MKYILFCFILFFSIPSESQVIGGNAFYKVIVTESFLTDKITGEIRERVIASEQVVTDLRIELIFNLQNALFNLTNNKDLAGIHLAASAYCDCSDPFFYSLSEGKSMQYNSAGPFMGEKQYLIEQPLDLKWKIEKETKKIDQYTCYKATALTLDSDGKSQPVEAWFCPEIPFAFGPRGFGGLPGLILELRYDRSVIGLESLKLSSKPVQIKMPTEGKHISFAEFHNINKAKLAKFLEEQQK